MMRLKILFGTRVALSNGQRRMIQKMSLQGNKRNKIENTFSGGNFQSFCSDQVLSDVPDASHELYITIRSTR